MSGGMERGARDREFEQKRKRRKTLLLPEEYITDIRIATLMKEIYKLLKETEGDL